MTKKVPQGQRKGCRKRCRKKVAKNHIQVAGKREQTKFDDLRRGLTMNSHDYWRDYLRAARGFFCPFQGNLHDSLSYGNLVTIFAQLLLASQRRKAMAGMPSVVGIGAEGNDGLLILFRSRSRNSSLPPPPILENGLFPFLRPEVMPRRPTTPLTYFPPPPPPTLRATHPNT